MDLQKLSVSVNKKANASIKKIIILLCAIAGLLIVTFLTQNSFTENESQAQIYSSKVESMMKEKIAFINTIASGVTSSAVEGDMYAYVDTMVDIYDDVSAVYVCIQQEDVVYSDGIMTYMSGGWVPDDDFVVSERGWFVGAKASDEVFVSEPYVDEQSGNICITLARTIYKDGEFFGVAGLDMYLDDIVSYMASSYQSDRYVFIATEAGTILTHPSEEMALSLTNSQNINEANEGRYAKVTANDFVRRYIWDYDGKLKTAISKKIDCGWDIISIKSNRVIYIMIGLIIICSAIVVFVVLTVAKKSLDKFITPMFLPLENLSNNVSKITDGELEYEFEVDNHSKEINELSNTLNTTMRGLQQYINQITDTVTAISDKDLSFEVDGEYAGDYEKIKLSLINIMNVLNENFAEINEQATAVLEYSNNLADTSESVAESATSQSTSVLSASEEMNVLTTNMEKITEYANSIKNNTDAANDILVLGQEEMKELVDAMEEIADCYEDIAGFIDEINNIASQTNLLSLNASIEAARAGEAGRGFAVVAGEINTLSENSAQASANISSVIDKSHRAVEKGKKLVNRTEQSIEKSVATSVENVKMVSEIVAFVETQKESSEEVSASLRNISEMVESNAAAAQENSAISIQLGDCAKALMNTVAQFKLK